VEPYRAELHAHCYRMLGSVHDADDALQEALLGAWRGLAGFEGRSSLGSWLYRITTNACLRLLARRPRRVLAVEYGPAAAPEDDLGEPVAEPGFLQPYPDDRLGPQDRSAAPAEDDSFTPDQREISRLDNAIDKVVVSDSLTPDDTQPWRHTTRIVRRADAHRQIPS
jgi:RNA polymerase sigma factor (sigma-70 family)